MILILSALLSSVSCGKLFAEDTTVSEHTLPTYESASVQTEAEMQTDEVTEVQVTEPTETDGTYESDATSGADGYDEDWITVSLSEQIMADDENWTFTGWNTPLYYDGYAGSAESGSGFTLSGKQYIGASRTYKFEFELYTPSVSDGDDRDKTLFVGLRRQNELTTASDGDGIWLSFKDDKMCLLGAGDELSDALHEYDLPCRFTDGFTKISIEDDQREGIIRVYVQAPDGEKQLVYKIHVNTDDDSTTVFEVYSWQDDFDTVTESVRYDIETFRGGYVALWSNNRAKIYVKNAALKPR